jgi:hypothetical protein
MSTFWIAVLALAVPPGEGAAQSRYAPAAAAVAEQPAAAPRTGTKLRDAVREALRRWAKPSDQQAEQAAREFLGLYGELQRDTSLSKAQRDELRGKVRSRLSNLAQQINKLATAERRLAKRDLPRALAGGNGAGVLAQWGGMGPAGFGGMMPGRMAGMGMGMGNGAVGPVVEDYGQDLVDVIQATIAPHTWDVNGGPGSIYYWRPGRAIVVRATDEVHNDIGGLVEQLQRAGN